MVLLTHNTEQNLSTGRWAPEHGAGRTKTCGCGADLLSFPRPLVGVSEPDLPLRRIAGKRTKKIVQAGVSRMYPAFCTVTASGSIRRPAAGSFFCFGFHPTTQQARAGDPALRRPTGYGFHLRWTHRKCRTSALGVGPTR